MVIFKQFYKNNKLDHCKYERYYQADFFLFGVEKGVKIKGGRLMLKMWRW